MNFNKITDTISAPNMYSVGAASQGSAAYSLAARTKKLKQFLTPAPGNYEVDKYLGTLLVNV